MHPIKVPLFPEKERKDSDWLILLCVIHLCKNLCCGHISMSVQVITGHNIFINFIIIVQESIGKNADVFGPPGPSGVRIRNSITAIFSAITAICHVLSDKREYIRGVSRRIRSNESK